MTNEIISKFITEHLMLHMVLITLSVAMLILAVAVDLIFGIKKAKENGEATTSTGYKKTCDKMRKYFSPLIVLVGLDFIACAVLPLPAFSMLWAGYCIFCEFVSVREKSWQKAELRAQERTMKLIVENKDDIINGVVELMAQKSKTETLK